MRNLFIAFIFLLSGCASTLPDKSIIKENSNKTKIQEQYDICDAKILECESIVEIDGIVRCQEQLKPCVYMYSRNNSHESKAKIEKIKDMESSCFEFGYELAPKNIPANGVAPMIIGKNTSGNFKTLDECLIEKDKDQNSIRGQFCIRKDKCRGTSAMVKKD